MSASRSPSPHAWIGVELFVDPSELTAIPKGPTQKLKRKTSDESFQALLGVPLLALIQNAMHQEDRVLNAVELTRYSHHYIISMHSACFFAPGRCNMCL